jgi:hypothetical protein
VSIKNIEEMHSKLAEVKCSDTDTIVFDLFGNTTYRFEQFDGTLSMPYRVNGRYHLAGNIVTCEAKNFTKTMETASKLFLAKKNMNVVVVPPLPRYIFVGCCSQEGHRTNIASNGHAEKLLKDVTGLRHQLKQFASRLGITKCRVLESCCVTSCPPTANTDSRLEALRTVTAADGVHFQQARYKNLVDNILRGENLLNTRTALPNTVERVYYWRGFRSPIGKVIPAGLQSHGRGRSGRYARGPSRKRGESLLGCHPYRRRK